MCRVLMSTRPLQAMAATSTADLMEWSSEGALPRSEDIKAEGWCRGDSNFQVLPPCPVSFRGNYRRVPWQDEELWLEHRGAMLRLAHTPKIDVLINSVGGNPVRMYICISNCHSVHFKYLTILYVNYTSINVKIF